MATGGDEEMVNAFVSVQQQRERKRYARKRIFVTCCLFIILIIVIVLTNLPSDSSTNWERRLLSIPSAEQARNNSFHLTRKPHILASEQNTIYGLYIEELLKEFGFETSVQYLTVNVSRFDDAQAYMFMNDEKIQLNLSEAVIASDPTSSTPLRNQSFLGWASSGNVTSNLIYVNYALRDDFRTLEALGIDLTNAIGIARYGGGMFRGVKADQADQFGLAGLILYSDPKDDGFGRGEVFPDGPWLPETGYQRGSVRYTFKCPGNVDPLRIENRCGMDITQVRPNIPVIALSYGNAQLLMQNMAGFATDEIYGNINLSSWQGGMDFTYRTGLNNDINGTKINLYIANSEPEAEMSNIFGIIYGDKYQNETILIGGHRDAWVFGAADPISGQTAIIEIARAFGRLTNDGWKPRRNIMIASWDAEEQSLIGSTIFTEVNHSLVESTIVTYFNLDVSVAGPDFRIRSDPLISRLVIESMKKIKAPYSNNSDEMLYDMWKQRNFPNTDDVYTDILGSGSDFVPFYHHYGISCIYGGMGGEYGTYHSVYDSFNYMEIVDRDWERNIAMAQHNALIAFEMANNDIIPFNVTNLYVSMNRWLNNDMDNVANANNCSWNDIAPSAVSLLQDSIDAFGETAVLFDDEVDSLSSNDNDYDDNVLWYNDALKKLTRQFLIEDGLPDRKYYKNVLVAPDILTGYAAYPFPYIAYAFQYDCTQTYITDTTTITAQIIDAASEFVQSYLRNI